MSTHSIPRILFSSPCGPYPRRPVESDPIDYFYYRNTLRQGVFQLRSFQSWHSLHFLAQNIPIDSVVLENPSFRQFQKEINGGSYDLLAIGFTLLLSGKVLQMLEWLKTRHPEIEIILGGYGTAIFQEDMELSSRLRALADHICYGEGLEFLQQLISQRYGFNSPAARVQNLLPAINSFFRTRIPLFRQIVLVGGLGCVYGCSFCATSSQFNRRYYSLFSGRQLFECLLQQTEQYPDIQSAIIYEEDFLAQKDKVSEFMECFSASTLAHKPFLITVFASVKSLLQYSMKDLIRCGIGTVFVGVESLDDQVLSDEGLIKRQGKVEVLFAQLHSHGINTLGSLVVGWDSQSLEVAMQDTKGFIALNPTFYQVVPLHIVPGTRLWDSMKAEGRLLPGYQPDTDSIASLNFQPHNFAREQVHQLVMQTYSGLVKEGGPWPFRVFENLLQGILGLQKSPSDVLARRAGIYRQMIFPIGLLAVVSVLFFRGRGFLSRWKKCMKQFFNLSPFYALLSVVVAPLLFLALHGLYLWGYVSHHWSMQGDQPNYIRKTYRGRKE